VFKMIRPWRVIQNQVVGSSCIDEQTLAARCAAHVKDLGDGWIAACESHPNSSFTQTDPCFCTPTISDLCWAHEQLRLHKGVKLNPLLQMNAIRAMWRLDDALEQCILPCYRKLLEAGLQYLQNTLDPSSEDYREQVARQCTTKPNWNL